MAASKRYTPSAPMKYASALTITPLNLIWLLFGVFCCVVQINSRTASEERMASNLATYLASVDLPEPLQPRKMIKHLSWRSSSERTSFTLAAL